MPLSKKGELSLTINYREITLSTVDVNIYKQMLLNRLEPHVDPKLRINQNGCQRNRSTVAQILVLQRLLEGIEANKLPAVMTFIDFIKSL